MVLAIVNNSILIHNELTSILALRFANEAHIFLSKKVRYSSLTVTIGTL